MKEGDILFYRTEQGTGWVGIFDHISDELFPCVYNKICVEADNGNIYTSVSTYVKRGSHCLCSLRGIKGFRAATPDEVQLLMDVLKRSGYYYDEEELRVKELPKGYCWNEEYQFEPFERVLVRDEDDREWTASLFSHMNTDPYNSRPYACTGWSWKQCIPFKGNEHLLGTTNNVK